jgi:hypothetical protein
VIGGTDASSQADEASSNEVSNLRLRSAHILMGRWRVSQMRTQTQIHACHHDRPSNMDAEAIIQVLILKLSAIQNATKFLLRHCRRSGSTGFKSWFARSSCGTYVNTQLSHSAARQYRIHLSIGKAWLALDGQYIGPVGQLGVLDLLHGRGCDIRSTRGMGKI